LLQVQQRGPRLAHGVGHEVDELHDQDGQRELRHEAQQTLAGSVNCPCGGRRAVVAFVVDPALAHSVLGSLGLPVEPTRFAPARASPQAELAGDNPA